MVRRPPLWLSGKPRIRIGIKEVDMPTWAIVLIIVLLILAFFGGRRYL